MRKETNRPTGPAFPADPYENNFFFWEIIDGNGEKDGYRASEL